MASGRGFVHVNAEGDLEPCPFSPFSDVNLREVPLREALQSRFLREVRESDAHLSEAGGGCALWTSRDWLESLLGGSVHHRGQCAGDDDTRPDPEEPFPEPERLVA